MYITSVNLQDSMSFGIKYKFIPKNSKSQKIDLGKGQSKLLEASLGYSSHPKNNLKSGPILKPIDNVDGIDFNKGYSKLSDEAIAYQEKVRESEKSILDVIFDIVGEIIEG